MPSLLSRRIRCLRLKKERVSRARRPSRSSADPVSFGCWLAVLSAVVVLSGCRGGSAPESAREDAYRANNRGVAVLERFEYPQAAAAFRDALQLEKGLGIAHLNLSLALLYGEELAAADREAGEAARLLPEAPQPPYVRGLIARAENRTDDALREFERVRRIDGDDPGAN